MAGILLSAGCTEPALQEPEEPSGSTEGADPGADELATGELHAAIAELRATVTAAREELTRDELGQGETRTALELLLDRGTGGTPLLPSTSTERGDAASQDDAFTTVLTLARNAGGELGQNTVAVLRDTIAGDLGAWERDAEGMVETVESTIAGPPPLEQLEADVLDLPGDGTRALAWVMLATRTSDDEMLRTYADRAVAHLDIVLVGLSQLEKPAAEESDADRAAASA